MLSLFSVGCLMLSARLAQGETPIELGRVKWGREAEAAWAESRASGRPLLLFFQEVPG